ncbi:MAG: S41 family peptidase [Victivallaceae bacterium]|nr:S41 family peptidase [Victivallaceae bacterium]
MTLKKLIIQLTIMLAALQGIAAFATVPAKLKNSKSALHNPYAKRADKVFNEVWQEICKRNFDRKLAKKFNKKILTEYLPQAKQCRNDIQLAQLLNRMIKELGQSHIGVLPPVSNSFNQAIKISRRNRKRPVVKQPEKKSSHKRQRKVTEPDFIDTPADIGLTPCNIDGKLYVLQLRSKFPAELAGIKLGEQIIAIDGVKLTPDKPAPVSWSRITSLMLSGYPGTTVNLTMQRYNGKQYSLKLKRRRNGFKWFKLGVMPKFFSEFELKILPGNIGYIRFSAFLPEEISKISRAVNHELKTTDGLIIDLRDNVGGMILATQWLAGWLYGKPVPIGSLKMHGATLKPVSYPQVNGYRKPLAILINDGSFSCAELFPAAMQDAKAAKIFGSSTLGKCLPSQFLVLPSGFRLQTVFGDHFRTTGKRVEGIGVTPDVQIKLDPKQLRHGRDSVIEAAREYLITP